MLQIETSGGEGMQHVILTGRFTLPCNFKMWCFQFKRQDPKLQTFANGGDNKTISVMVQSQKAHIIEGNVCSTKKKMNKINKWPTFCILS